MNYIKQINAFWQYRILNRTTHSETALYFAILHCANVSGWCQDVCIPNSTLIDLAALSDASQLSKVRNKLIQLKLIKYKQGKGRQAGTYNIVKLYDDKCLTQLFDSEQYNQDNCLLSLYDSKQYNEQYNEQYNKSTTNSTPYINKNKTKQNETDTPIIPSNADAESVMRLYNEICVSYPRINTLSQRRIRAINRMLKSYTVEQIKTAFAAAETSEYLKGNNEKGWTAVFEWIINNVDILLDGYFTDRSTENMSEIERMFAKKYEGEL